MTNQLINPLPVLEQRIIRSRIELSESGTGSFDGGLDILTANLPKVSNLSLRNINLNGSIVFAKSVGMAFSPYFSLIVPAEIAGEEDEIEYESEIVNVTTEDTNYVVSHRLVITESIFITFNSIDFPESFQLQLNLKGNAPDSPFSVNYFLLGNVCVCNY